jgi:hypothetical protein
LIRHRGDFSGDYKGAVSFGGKLGLLMLGFQIGGFEPDLITYLVLGGNDGFAFLCLIDGIDGYRAFFF